MWNIMNHGMMNGPINWGMGDHRDAGSGRADREWLPSPRQTHVAVGPRVKHQQIGCLDGGARRG
jgi:hypothetical protein